MDFNDIRALLSALIDDEIDEDTRHEAERLIAQCEEARTLMDEAEALDVLIARDAELLADEPTRLPPGFEASVLAQTVEADRIAYGRRWTTWTGWVAAAACLTLAMTIWVMDRQYWLTESMGPGNIAQNMQTPGDGVSGHDSTAAAVHASYTQRSWTIDTPLDAPNPQAPKIPIKQPVATSGFTGPSNNTPEHDSDTIEQTRPGGMASILQQLHAIPNRSRAFEQQFPLMEDDAANNNELQQPQMIAISDEDAHTLRSASALLEQLAAVETSSFRDVETIRLTAERDGVLNGLAAARANVDATQRPTLLAVESILLRIVRGPISQDDLRLMRADVQQLDLAAQLQSMTRTPISRTSF